jgi:polyadenylate-binding protein
MRNENGESRGFGFVSFQTPEQGEYTTFWREMTKWGLKRFFYLASTAMTSMNGLQLGSKQIVVRLHEPKQLRQEKLAQRFGHNGHPRSASGATSPTVSEAGESYIGWSSPRQRTSTLGSPVATQYERPERGRRGSGSYYNVGQRFSFCFCFFFASDVLSSTACEIFLFFSFFF